ncbi:MAG TPA: hypothetical protein DD670_08345 [Planctomycetaceae bacterium]|nr:hypothetical protein [Planctomycetaceae bacterium]
MSLGLLILLTAVYFIRPSEWVPGLMGTSLYLWIMVAAMIVSAEKLVRSLSPESLRAYPVSACVAGLWVVTLVSELLNAGAWDAATGFGKASVFYFLMVGVVDSRTKLALFLQSFAGVLFFVALLIILNYHGVVATNMGYALAQTEDSTVGVSAVRVAAVGGATFDPNDTAALVVLGILTSLHYTTLARPRPLRAVWLAAAVPMVYVLQLTDSRGGFLALMTGLGVYVVARWGRKGVVAGLVLLPLVAAYVASERMAGIGSALRDDTGQNRIQFWCDGLLLFKRHFLLGTGPGGFVAHVGKAAHNTFVQAFAELGAAGGTLFLGAFAYGLWANYRLVRPSNPEAEEEEGEDEDRPERADPTVALVLSLLSAYAVGILALNHLFATNTLLVLGLATVVTALNDSRNTLPGVTLLARACVLSAVFVVATHVTARLLVRW